MPQTSYVRSVLGRFDVSRASPIPAFPSENLRGVKEKNVEGVSFRDVVGSLINMAHVVDVNHL